MKITRRNFLGHLTVATVAAGAPHVAIARRSYPWPLGVQLWSVNAELDADFDGTLRSLASLGFREVEAAGLHGQSPTAFLRSLEKAGLKACGAHYSMADLFDDADRHIAEARAIGAQWLVASAPKVERPLQSGDWIRAMRGAMTLPTWKHNAAKLNIVGRKAKAAGLQFAYHNHPFEFARFEGERGFDVLMAGTDPHLVKVELDVAWAVAGGADPVSLIERHRGRVRLLHVKGLKHRPATGTFGPDFSTGIVGKDDVVPWPEVFAAARHAGVTHAFVEQEPPHVRPIMQLLGECRDYLMEKN